MTDYLNPPCLVCKAPHCNDPPSKSTFDGIEPVWLCPRCESMRHYVESDLKWKRDQEKAQYQRQLGIDADQRLINKLIVEVRDLREQVSHLKEEYTRIQDLRDFLEAFHEEKQRGVAFQFTPNS